MQSGINDYDDQWLLGWTVVNPTLDFSPFDFLQEVDLDGRRIVVNVIPGLLDTP